LVERLNSSRGIASPSNSFAGEHRDSSFDEENVAASYKNVGEKNAVSTEGKQSSLDSFLKQPGMKPTEE
jgi:hypothetical protein